MDQQLLLWNLNEIIKTIIFIQVNKNNQTIRLDLSLPNYILGVGFVIISL